jgi:hypothetical protein
MPPKPGLKTTEFWITLIGAIGAVCAAAAGVLPSKEAAAIMTVSAAAYKLSRGLAKISPPSSGSTDGLYPIEPPGDSTEAPPAGQ